MVRRWWRAVAGLSLVLVTGCGSLMIALERGEPIWLLHRVDYTVDVPSHRVALATLDVFKEELAEVQVDDIELTPDDRFKTPDGQPLQPGPIWTLTHDVDAQVRYLLDNCRQRTYEDVDGLLRLQPAYAQQRRTGGWARFGGLWKHHAIGHHGDAIRTEPQGHEVGLGALRHRHNGGPTVGPGHE